jgi:enediyne biosynthesis protein E2
MGVMPTYLGALRRLVLSPSLDDVSFAGRGFPVPPSVATDRLEAVPQAVICGFEWAMETRTQRELVSRLALVDVELRGFAYEGATMALTVRDVMPGPGSHRTRDLLRGPGAPHLLLAYIGIGFAMARLPRPLWKKVVPDLAGSAYHPTMSWLAVDGYGFDRAYFDTAKWIDRQWRCPAYPWDGAPDYFPRAIDQGIGRALWFVHAGQTADVAAAVDRFATQRRADLWSGVGLAATFAGGCPAPDLLALRRTARAADPDYEAQLALGAVLAAKARSHAGYVPEHSEAAVRALADLSAGGASALADEATRVEPASGEPRYEAWRRAIRARVPDALVELPR